MQILLHVAAIFVFCDVSERLAYLYNLLNFNAFC
jgi:hypothetical protein